MKRFVITILSVSILFLIAHLAIVRSELSEWSNYFIVLYVYFPLITITNYGILLNKIDKRPQTFVTTFMGVMTVKLLLSLSLLLIILYPNPEIKIPFSLLFVLFYFSFSAISSADLFKKLRAKS